MEFKRCISYTNICIKMGPVTRQFWNKGIYSSSKTLDIWLACWGQGISQALQITIYSDSDGDPRWLDFLCSLFPKKLFLRKFWHTESYQPLCLHLQSSNSSEFLLYLLIFSLQVLPQYCRDILNSCTQLHALFLSLDLTLFLFLSFWLCHTRWT